MRVSVPLLALLPWLVVAGCGPRSSQRGDGGDERDGAAAADLAVRVDGGGAAGPDIAFPGTFYHFVMDRVLLPQMKGEYAYSLNGDNFPDNQFALLAVEL